MTKKIISITAIVLVTALLLSLSVFAFFTDNVAKAINAITGTVRVLVSEPEIQTTYLGTGYSSTIQNWNPGDVNKIKWNIENKGNKSVDTRHIIYLFWDVDVAEDIHEIGSMYLYPTVKTDGNAWTETDVATDIAAGAANALGKVEVQYDVVNTGGTGTKTRIGYRYIFNSDVLAGVGAVGAEDGANDSTEVVGGGSKNDGDKYKDFLEFFIAFDPSVNSTMQDQPFEAQIVTQVKQHRNTNDTDWKTVA